MKKFYAVLSALLCCAILLQGTVFAQEDTETEIVSAQGYIEEAVASLKWLKLAPKYGIDTNICEVLAQKFEDNGYDGIGVAVESVEEVYSGGGIDENGGIEYFFADPDDFRGIWSAAAKVTFLLTYNDAELSYTPSANVIIEWDKEKVRDYIRENVSDYLDFETIAAGNTDADNITENLTLPQYLNGNRNVRILWSSNNTAACTAEQPSGSIDNVMYGDYIGEIHRADRPQPVTLTAELTFPKADNVSVYKTFTVTVAPSEVIPPKDKAQALLDNLDFGDMTDADGNPLDENAVTGDITLPTPGKLGVVNREFNVILTVDNEDDREFLNVADVKNAAGVYVFRPLAEQGDRIAAFTVTLVSTADEKEFASKSFEVNIKAIDNAEIADMAEDMRKVGGNFFEYIRGENADASAIDKDLAAFYGLYKENGRLVPRSFAERTRRDGFTAKIVNPQDPVDYRRRFITSDSDVIEADTLRVTPAEENTKVEITACLSSEVYDAYLKSDEYPLKYSYDYTSKYEALLKDICNVRVSAVVTVKGTNPGAGGGLHGGTVQQNSVNVSFELKALNKKLISENVQGLKRNTNVFELFKKILDEKGYSYNAPSGYVVSVTAPNGTTYAEFSHGENSGWMYFVNGEIPEMYMSDYKLENGDKVTIEFVGDYNEFFEDTYTPTGNTDNKKNEESVKSLPEDITEQTQYYSELVTAYEKGWLGAEDNKLNPDMIVTRAAAVDALCKLAAAEITDAAQVFADVSAEDWFFAAVYWANANNIVAGVSETEFAPLSEITAEQLCCILYRYAGKPEFERTPPRTDVSEYAADAVMWYEGISGGITVLPKSSITRAQLAKMLCDFQTGALQNM